MVEDWHHNIFHPYGEILLENNVTKALINVLENCDKEKILKTFLERIVSEKINFPKKLKDIKYSMQETPTDEAKIAKQKYILGISPETEDIEEKININEHRANSLSEEYEKDPDRYRGEKAKIERLINIGDVIKKSDLPKNLRKIFSEKEINVEKLQYIYDIVFRKSRPDAMIWCNDFAILIENKIWGGQIPSQIKRHKDSLGENVKAVEKSWIKDIYPTIKEIEEKTELSEKKQEQESKEKFLLKEFKEYLEMIGLAPFVGFRKEDFEKSEDKEHQQDINKKMDAFIEEVRKKLPGGLQEFQHVRQSKQRNCYFSRFPSSEYTKHAQFSFEIDEGGFYMWVTMCTDSAVKNLIKNIEKNPEEFISILKELKENDEYDSYIQLNLRIAHYDKKSGKYLRGRDKHKHLRDVFIKDVEEIKNFILKKYKSIRLKKNFLSIFFYEGRHEVDDVFKRKDKFVDDAINFIKKFKPIHDFANKGQI